MYLGRLCEVASRDAMFQRPRHPYTRLLLDTIPDLDMTGRERVPVAGEVPNPINPPTGCAFHPRCPFANDRCKQERPELQTDPTDGAQIACHAFEEGRLPAAAISDGGLDVTSTPAGSGRPNGTSTRDEALARVRVHFDGGEFQVDLARRIAIRTESQESSQRQELYRYLLSEIGPWLRRYDFSIELFENADPAGGPFLLATRHEDDGAPTLLTYGHGDVVRGIPEQWRDGLDPWSITSEGDRWYGRGTADNKGQHSIVMAALAQVIETRGKLGFNAKVLIETGEEIGSPGLRTFCEEHKDKLAADLFLASDGPRQSSDVADVSLGNRGGISFDLIVKLREGSRHSGHYGGLIEDPGITLAHALATITDKRGRILVKDWLPKSVPRERHAGPARARSGCRRRRSRRS